jgi:hypothetical protein
MMQLLLAILGEHSGRWYVGTEGTLHVGDLLELLYGDSSAGHIGKHCELMRLSPMCGVTSGFEHIKLNTITWPIR